ncbi:HNH endonuclease [Streptomyces sp. NPDC092952]|uniref:HNH endonuclease n=1 Tax=Streptomyces sp. NPDC092952 TaxID=3366018 RepID=UPI0038159920
MSARHLPAPRRRTRKEHLARRHGWHCAYCHRPFTSPQEATLDHIVPKSLYRTRAVVNLTLACRPCNQAKADRLPLSMALLLVWSQGRDQRDETGHAPRHTGRPTGRPVDRPPRPGGGRVKDRPVPDPTAPVDWRLLARLAHAHHEVTPVDTRSPARSGRDLPERPDRAGTTRGASRPPEKGAHTSRKLDSSSPAPDQPTRAAQHETEEQAA